MNISKLLKKCNKNIKDLTCKDVKTYKQCN